LDLGFEIVFASIAAILTILSLRTFMAIRHLGVGKSFWLPVLASSVLFVVGSAIPILWELGYLAATVPIEAVEATKVLALCVLLGGVYSYSRRIKGSLKEEFTIPEQLFQERLKIESGEEDTAEPETAIEEKKAHLQRVEPESEPEPKGEASLEVTVGCPHHLGYLRTLARDRPIPDECLHCDRIIECKYSPIEASASRTRVTQ
jgi:hypothetical protein